MTSSARQLRLHVVALDPEAAACVASLPSADQWELRHWDSLEGLLAHMKGDGIDEAPLRVVVAVARPEDVDVQQMRALHAEGHRIDVLLVVRTLTADEHLTLLKAGIGRVERLPLPPYRPEVLLADRSYLSTLFPGTVQGTRREQLEFDLESRPENVPALVRLLCERCDEMGHPNDFVRAQLPLVIDEAVTNAMRHGNGWDPSKTVFVRAELDAERVEILIVDQGDGFVRDDVHDPLHADRRGHAGGRGLFLMESMMDEVRYEDGGRRVVLTKSLAPTPAATL